MSGRSKNQRRRVHLNKKKNVVSLLTNQTPPDHTVVPTPPDTKSNTTRPLSPTLTRPLRNPTPPDHSVAEDQPAVVQPNVGHQPAVVQPNVGHNPAVMQPSSSYHVNFYIN